MTEPIERSWLIQRLHKPITGGLSVLGKDNPFAFGGGLRNGGLSGEAMDLLRDIFGFDYMGSAEFEFGNLPKALNKIANEANHYVAFSFSWPLAEVEKHWKDRTRKPVKGEATVYVICRKGWEQEVMRRIRLWAAPYDRKNRDQDLKEQTCLKYSLRPDPENHDLDTRRCGWLELDNGFFFFTDHDMWTKTANLFGVQTDG